MNGSVNTNYNTSYSYDKHGNLKTLMRYGKTGSNDYGVMDNLTYTYKGNQLYNVSDSGTDPLYSGAFNFVDGNKGSSQDYKYDSNGNMQEDSNKKITKIQYNPLNLPLALQFTNGNRTDYLYDSDGIKHRVTYSTAVNNVSVPMGEIRPLSSDEVSSTHTVDYCGNVIYEGGNLSKILTEVGYITLSGNSPTYHYYLKDHQGNNRVVTYWDGSKWVIEQVNHYYPFGGLFAEGTSGSPQPYKYNGKELDRTHGLDWYDYSARHYDAGLGRFTTMDPLAEKYFSFGSYTYCINNPIYFIDKKGLEPGPGDLFKTQRAAAKDWGMYYNGASIIRKREMGSSIYTVRDNGKLKGYSYSAANEGEHSVSISYPPNGEIFTGTIHSHGDADIRHINNEFSKADIKYIEKTKKNGYLATPSGNLLEYNPYSKKITIISNTLPSDPKDPERKNNVIPKDIPAEKGKQKLEELHQKPDLNIPIYQKEKIHWTF